MSTNDISSSRLHAQRNRLRRRALAGLVALLMGLLGATLWARGEELTSQFRITRAVEAASYEIAVASGPAAGRWSLKFEKAPRGARRGATGRLQIPRSTLAERLGPVIVEFKGSDEELQAILDWLGSLE